MVSDDLKRLVVQHRIKQNSLIDEWPSAFSSVFRDIQKLGRMRYEEYVDGDTGTCENGPDLGRRMTGNRAKRIAERADQLTKSTTNERAWRMGIENDVLKRFSVEVNCPTCGHRLWRSEIESEPVGGSRMQMDLERRRLAREPCKCAPSAGPQDPYEAGTDKLFIDLVDELVKIADIAPKPVKQIPDRIFCLRETETLRNLLDQSPRVLSQSDAATIRDLLIKSPFPNCLYPLWFPFLVVEAKSDAAQSSFSDLQTQSAFPIRSFLNMQEHFQSREIGAGRAFEPLVWFLGYKGSEWKVYGCYMGQKPDSTPVYHIHNLWGGNICSQDGALQLLLIIDYIVDWARDVFRWSIIAQLNSLITGREFDRIIPGSDGDIASMGKVRSWMTHSSDTISRNVVAELVKPASSECINDSGATLPSDTKSGAIRKLSNQTFAFSGLRLTEENIESALALSDGPVLFYQQPTLQDESPSARKLLRELIKWKEVFTLTGADLDMIENQWIGEDGSRLNRMDEHADTKYYTMMEYRCYLDTAWRVVREINCLAISKTAFEVLIQRANFQRKHSHVQAFKQSSRGCSTRLIREAIDCLRSGSQWQVIHSAISSAHITLCPGPKREGRECSIAAEWVDFRYTRSPRVQLIIEDYLTVAAEEHRPFGRRSAENRHSPKRPKGDSDSWLVKTCDRSFRRVVEMTARIAKDPHVKTGLSGCSRCRQSKEDHFQLKHWDQGNMPSRTASNAILVSSLEERTEEDSTHQEHHRTGVFLLDGSSEQLDPSKVLDIVQDLAQRPSIYHTILHGPQRYIAQPEAVLWNLPHCYRKSTRQQRWDIGRWIKELNGLQISASGAPIKRVHHWVHQQMLLSFLGQGMAYGAAMQATTKACDQQRAEEAKGLSPRPRANYEMGPNGVSLEKFFSGHRDLALRVEGSPSLPEEP